MRARELITEHLDLWTGAVTKKSGSGRGGNGKVELTGVKKLRELILELAVRGKLVSQDMPTESSSDLIAVMEKEKTKLVNSKRIKRPKATSSVSQDNRPFAIKDNWSWHSLGALGYTQTGSTPAKSQSELFGSDIPFLKPGDISESGEICYGNEGLSEAGKEVLGKWAEKDSILMVCIGTIGKCGLIEQQCTFNQQINSVTPFVPETSQFLLLCLKSPYFQNEAWEKSSSTTISILNKGKWESIPVPLPPLGEQHRIVQKVDELMALCDQLEQQTSDQIAAHDTLVDTLLDTLIQSQNATELAENWTRLAAHFDTLFTTEQSIDKLKQTILTLAVMGLLVEQKEDEEHAELLIDRLSKDRLIWLKENQPHNPECKTMLRKLKKLSLPESPFPLPTGWKPAHLIELCRILVDCHNKTAPYVKEGIPIIRTSNIKERRFLFNDIKYVNDETYAYWSRRCPPESQDIIFTREAPMGEAAIIPNGKIWCLGQRTMLIRPMHDYISNRYLLLALTEPHLLERAAEKAIGSTVKHLRVGDVEGLVVPVPPLEEQLRIVQKVDELMALCDQLKERLNQASETRCQLAETIVESALQ